MTVIFFVPVGNMMIQIHRSRRRDEKQQEKLSEDARSKKATIEYILRKENIKHIQDTIKHPVVIATVLGLILNFAFDGKMPDVLHQPIKVAAATIPGIALVLIGFSMVRKERHLISSAVVPAAVLLIVKMVVTPVLLHTYTRIITEESESSKLLSDFGLLYGIISPATVIFQSGQEFRKAFAVMSVTLILTSFACFPVSYVVARFTIVTHLKLSQYIPQLSRVLFWTACSSIFCNVTVCLIMLWRKQLNRVPFCYITCLIFTQLLTSCGVLLWILSEKDAWATYCKMAFYYCGEISGYLWTAVLSIILVYNKKYSKLAENGFSILSFTVFSLSAFITIVTCLVMPYNSSRRLYVLGMTRSDYEFLQLITATVLLFISLMVVLVCLMKHYRQKSSITGERKDLQVYHNVVFYIQEPEEVANVRNKGASAAAYEIPCKASDNGEMKIYIEEILRSEGCEAAHISEERQWSFRLASLLLIQMLILLVRFIANMYKLFRCKAPEIMIPLEFLQSTLFIGQGVFILMIFGIDVRTIIISLKKWWRKMRRMKEENVSEDLVNNDSKGEAAQFCNQFYNYYFTRCFQDIAKERRWKDDVYQDSFWGHQMVDWLISEGLCTDDMEAEEKGQRLFTGGMIKHVTEKHGFWDGPYLYHFVKRKPEPT